MEQCRRIPALLVFAVSCCVAACGTDSGSPATSDRSTTATSTTTSTTTTEAEEDPPVEIELRLERRAEGTEGFEDLVRDTLTDPRGWTRAGFQFTFTDDAPYRVVVAEPDDVDALCLPYDTGATYSCQNGPTVALNADRWREATPTWPGTVDDYRRMLVNHEVGHLLGRHHARPACTDGRRAAVMFQQSSGLDGCQPNPWPLPWEIACAARHDEPIAPGYEPDAQATCGPHDV